MYFTNTIIIIMTYIITYILILLQWLSASSQGVDGLVLLEHSWLFSLKKNYCRTFILSNNIYLYICISSLPNIRLIFLKSHLKSSFNRKALYLSFQCSKWNRAKWLKLVAWLTRWLGELAVALLRLAVLSASQQANLHSAANLFGNEMRKTLICILGTSTPNNNTRLTRRHSRSQL